MNRWDIINHFIKKYNYQSYLEIGYFKGWSFDNVHCKFKVAVDPNPSKVSEQESAPINSVLIYPPHALYKMTSDDFFDHVKDGTTFRDHKWDIVFIDGLHEAGQVYRDIQNSLAHLSQNGTIILHDMNPPTYQHVTTGDPGGNWNGDCYKAFIKFRRNEEYLGYEAYVIDTDWGVGVIRKISDDIKRFPTYKEQSEKALSDWETFDKYRENVLNLLPVEAFKEREGVNATA